ncbi:MAG TPA: pseudouridine synthase [Polyangiales bacterium]|nr:pseudouridine synthase [Polyangiales bacterium]
MALQRLQKILAQAGVSSRRAAEQLIVAGRVRVNGRVISELGARANPLRDRVEVDGKRLVAERPVYFLMHKPRGVVTTLDDPEGRKNIADLLHGIPERLFPVGRLDFQTSGALLLTNDGAMAQALLHPTRRVPKVYHAKIEGSLDAQRLDLLRAGVTLDDGEQTAPAEVDIVRRDDKHTFIDVTISEGKNRQIHRMLDAVGRVVLRLTRLAFAELGIEGLRPGQVRQLTQAELSDLKQKYLNPGKKVKPRGGASPVAAEELEVADDEVEGAAESEGEDRGPSPAPSGVRVPRDAARGVRDGARPKFGQHGRVQRVRGDARTTPEPRRVQGGGRAIRRKSEDARGLQSGPVELRTSDEPRNRDDPRNVRSGGLVNKRTSADPRRMQGGREDTRTSEDPRQARGAERVYARPSEDPRRVQRGRADTRTSEDPRQARGGGRVDTRASQDPRSTQRGRGDTRTSEDPRQVRGGGRVDARTSEDPRKVRGGGRVDARTSEDPRRMQRGRVDTRGSAEPRSVRGGGRVDTRTSEDPRKVRGGGRVHARTSEDPRRMQRGRVDTRGSADPRKVRGGGRVDTRTSEDPRRMQRGRVDTRTSADPRKVRGGGRVDTRTSEEPRKMQRGRVDTRTEGVKHGQSGPRKPPFRDKREARTDRKTTGGQRTGPGQGGRNKFKRDR